MKVILQHTVQKLGKAGDVVEASAGYYRNFLQPRKLAVLASPGTMKKREEDIELLRKKADATHQEWVQLAERITQLGSINVFAKSGEGGKLYGKVTNKEVAAVLHKELGADVDKRLIKVDDISTLGTYKAHIKLATDVQSTIAVEVHPDGSQAQVEKQRVADATAGAAKAETANEASEEESAEDSVES
jgi:large subunit ribosomal protein L9